MKLQGFIVLIILFLVYRLWFSLSGTFSSGDWPYLYKEAIEEFSFLPQLDFLWLAPYYQILTKLLVQYIGFSWELVERLFWFWPFLLLSIASSYYLTKSWLGVLIYTINTYILMIVGGGQMGIAMAYSIAPFVLRRFMHIIEFFPKYAFRTSVLTGLLLSVLTMFDPRIAYITFLAVTIYCLLILRSSTLSRKGVVYLASIIILPLAIAGILNSYWIIPILSGNFSKEYQGIASAEGFKFLSFTDFSHAFSLLHPNWPENIFGKVYFLRPEFLIIPIIAFASLLFINTSKNNIKSLQRIIFFALLGLLGIFLAKGAKAPFGEVNEWLFTYMPGMNMFRDATKFYLLIVLSYSVLIPFALTNIILAIQRRIKKNDSLISLLCYGLFIFFWMFTIREAVRGDLGGTFESYSVPGEYQKLKDFLVASPQPYKTLWIPQRQRYGFSSKVHTALSGNELLNESNPVKIASLLRRDSIYRMLKSQNIRYVILPFDSQGELFLIDRSYSKALRDAVEKELSSTPSLSIERSFGNIVLYRLQ